LVLIKCTKSIRWDEIELLMNDAEDYQFAVVNLFSFAEIFQKN